MSEISYETFRHEFCRSKFEYARLAQLVEHITDTDGVPGSNPGTRTKQPPEGGFVFVRVSKVLKHFMSRIRKGSPIFSKSFALRKWETCTASVGSEIPVI